MSEAADQPVVDAATSAVPAGVEAVEPAATDDIDTEAFDRVEAPDDEAEPALGEDGKPIAPDKPTPAEDPETVEVDLGGQKVRVPKAVEPLLMMQADYTKKTQEVADLRRKVDEGAAALETERSQQVESLKAFRTEHLTIANQEAALADIDSQLAQYQKALPTAQHWTNLKAQDPAAYAQHAEQYDFLRRTRGVSEDTLKAAQTDLTAKEADLTTRQQGARNADLAKAWEATSSTLAKEIDGWTPPWQPGKGQDIAKFAIEQLGYKPEELREATDPRAWKMAHQVMTLTAENAKLKANQKQATASETALKSQAVTPAAKAPGTGAPARGVTDQLSDEEWMRRRNAQVAKRNRG